MKTIKDIEGDMVRFQNQKLVDRRLSECDLQDIAREWIEYLQDDIETAVLCNKDDIAKQYISQQLWIKHFFDLMGDE